MEADGGKAPGSGKRNKVIDKRTQLFTNKHPNSGSSPEQLQELWSRVAVHHSSYLGGCRAGGSVAVVTLRVYVVGGDLGWGAFDNVDVRHGKDALFGCARDLPLIPVLVHLSYHDYSLALKTKTPIFNDCTAQPHLSNERLPFGETAPRWCQR